MPNTPSGSGNQQRRGGAPNRNFSPNNPGGQQRQQNNPQTNQQNTPARQNESKGSDGTTLYDAICSECGKPTKIVFEPDGSRPVYCKKCRHKHEQARLHPQAAAQPAAEAKSPKEVLPKEASAPGLSLSEAVKQYPAKEKQPQRHDKSPAQAAPTPAPRPAPKRSKEVDVEGLRELLRDATSPSTAQESEASGREAHGDNKPAAD